MAINTSFLPKNVQAAIAGNPDLYKRSITDAPDRARSLTIDMGNWAGEGASQPTPQSGIASYWGVNTGNGSTPDIESTYNGRRLYDLNGSPWKMADGTVDFSTKNWKPGAEQAVLGSAKWDDQIGLMFNNDVISKYWIPDDPSFMDRLVPALILGAGAYGIGGGLLNAMNTGGFMPAGGAGFDSATMFSGGGGLSGGAGGAVAGGGAGGAAEAGGKTLAQTLSELGPYNASGPMSIPGGQTFVPGVGLSEGAMSVAGSGGLGGAASLGSGLLASTLPGPTASPSFLQQIKDLIKTPTPSGGGPGGSSGNGGGMNLADYLNLGGTVAGIGTSIWSGNKQADAASDAAKLQAAGQAAALEELKRQFDLSRADQMPWLTAGKDSLSQLAALMAPGGALTRKFSAADFEADPGYGFQLEEGEKAANRAAAARGGFNSGRTLKELMRYGQGLANTTYQDAYNRYNTDQSNLYNRLAGIAGTGQTAATTLGNAGANYAANIGNTLTGGANAQAASRIAGANARTSGYMGAANAITGGINNYQQSQLLSQLLRQYGA